MLRLQKETQSIKNGKWSDAWPEDQTSDVSASSATDDKGKIEVGREGCGEEGGGVNCCGEVEGCGAESEFCVLSFGFGRVGRGGGEVGSRFSRESVRRIDPGEVPRGEGGCVDVGVEPLDLVLACFTEPESCAGVCVLVGNEAIRGGGGIRSSSAKKFCECLWVGVVAPLAIGEDVGRTALPPEMERNGMLTLVLVVGLAGGSGGEGVDVSVLAGDALSGL